MFWLDYVEDEYVVVGVTRTYICVGVASVLKAHRGRAVEGWWLAGRSTLHTPARIPSYRHPDIDTGDMARKIGTYELKMWTLIFFIGYWL